HRGLIIAFDIVSLLQGLACLADRDRSRQRRHRQTSRRALAGSVYLATICAPQHKYPIRGIHTAPVSRPVLPVLFGPRSTFCAVPRQNFAGGHVGELSALIRRHRSSMITLLLHLLRLFPFLCGGHRQLALENLALHQQLAVYKRTMTRPSLIVSWRSWPIGTASAIVNRVG